MSKSEKGISPCILALIVVVSATFGFAVFFLSRALATHEILKMQTALAILAFLTAVFAGLALSLFAMLRRKHRILTIFKARANTDRLTELYNRSYLEPFLDNEIHNADKSNQQVSVIMVDLDHFKEINDTYGHVVGDQILTIFAQVVLGCMRKTDIIARYGGDEFIVVLPRTDTETARAIADRIRLEVTNAYIPPVEKVVISSISCSIGVSTYPVHCDSKSSLIRTSDLALYQAKHSGRNCTIVYQKEPVMS